MRYLKTILLLLICTFIAHSQVVISSDLPISFGTDFYASDAIEIEPGVTVECDGEFGSDLSIKNEGTISGSGKIFVGTTMTNTGIIAPGSTTTANPAVLSFYGPFSSGSGSVDIELNGTASTDYDQIKVFDNTLPSLGAPISGTATLSGTLNVTLGFVPAAGNSFTIITSVGALSGTFSTVNLPIVPGLCAKIIYNSNSVVIVYNAPLKTDPGFGSAPYFVNAGVAMPDISGTNADMDLTNDPLNQSLLQLNTDIRLVLPFFNAHQTNSIPNGGLKIVFNVGSKFNILMLPAVSVSNPFSWVSTTDMSGDKILTGTQVQDIPANYFTNLFFDVKPVVSCSSSGIANIIELPDCLDDENVENNDTELIYNILFDVSKVIVNATCFGGNGTATFTVTGGTAPYTYTSIPSLGVSFLGNVMTAPAGTYSVTIEDAVIDGCNTVVEVIIGQPDILAAVVTPTGVTCFGAGDGKIVISMPTGGSGTYDYSINSTDAMPNWQSSGTFTGLVPGIYQVAIRDANAITCIIDLDLGVGTEVTTPTNEPDLRIDPIGLTGNIYDFPTPFVHDYVVKLTNLNPAPASPVVIQIPRMAGYVLTLISTGPGIVSDPSNGPISYDNTSWGPIDESNQFFYRITGPTISCLGMKSVGLRVTRVTPNFSTFPFNIRVRQANFEVITSNNFTTIQIEGQ